MQDLDEEELKATRELKEINKIVAPEEKTADEMFEELGYKINKINLREIEYAKKIDDSMTINFWLLDEDFAKYIHYGACCINMQELQAKNIYYDVCCINMQELQAINKKCKELGWL